MTHTRMAAEGRAEKQVLSSALWARQSVGALQNVDVRLCALVVCLIWGPASCATSCRLCFTSVTVLSHHLVLCHIITSVLVQCWKTLQVTSSVCR